MEQRDPREPVRPRHAQIEQDQVEAVGPARRLDRLAKLPRLEHAGVGCGATDRQLERLAKERMVVRDEDGPRHAATALASARPAISESTTAGSASVEVSPS